MTSLSYSWCWTWELIIHRWSVAWKQPQKYCWKLAGSTSVLVLAKNIPSTASAHEYMCIQKKTLENSFRDHVLNDKTKTVTFVFNSSATLECLFHSCFNHQCESIDFLCKQQLLVISGKLKLQFYSLAPCVQLSNSSFDALPIRRQNVNSGYVVKGNLSCHSDLN